MADVAVPLAAPRGVGVAGSPRSRWLGDRGVRTRTVVGRFTV